MSAGHGELIEEARNTNPVGLYSADAGELIARLADALEQQADASHGPCRCDPVESGEEHCNGGCILRAELAAAERRLAELEQTAHIAKLWCQRTHVLPICGNTAPDDQSEAIVRSLRAETGGSPEGGCSRLVEWLMAYRCLECGRWMHAECLRLHFSEHGAQHAATVQALAAAEQAHKRATDEQIGFVVRQRDRLALADAAAAEFRTALVFYADEANYDEETGAAGKWRRLPNTVNDPGETVFEHDGGDVARGALLRDAGTNTLAEIERLKDQVNRLCERVADAATLARDLAAVRRALRTYGRHGEFCPARTRIVTGHGHGKDVVPVMGACDCGFADAR